MNKSRFMKFRIRELLLEYIPQIAFVKAPDSWHLPFIVFDLTEVVIEERINFNLTVNLYFDESDIENNENIADDIQNKLDYYYFTEDARHFSIYKGSRNNISDKALGQNMRQIRLTFEIHYFEYTG